MPAKKKPADSRKKTAAKKPRGKPPGKDASKLTTRQRRFAEEWVVDLNNTRAAIRAGYSEKTAAEQGSRLFRNVKVRAYIDRLMEEQVMGSTEAMMRLSKYGSGTLDPFLDADDKGDVYINLGSERAKRNYMLLRKVKQRKTKTKRDQIEREIIQTEIEIYDAKSALVDILKIHGKLIETTLNVNFEDLTDDQLSRIAAGESISEVLANKGQG